MPSQFIRRSSQKEIMDDLDCSGEVVFQTLRELEVINRFLGGNLVTLDGIRRLLKRRRTSGPVSIADIGCGGGDILRMVAFWGVRNNLNFRLYGIDANPTITGFATANTPASLNIAYEAANIFSESFRQKKYDIILATLFTHHFTDDELVSLLVALGKQAQIGIVINDIHRHWLAYYSIRILTSLFSKSSMVKFDAPVSVLRAFSRKDLELVLRRAGMDHYSIRWKWAFRWQLIIQCERLP